jgi:hypothetical protein
MVKKQKAEVRYFHTSVGYQIDLFNQSEEHIPCPIGTVLGFATLGTSPVVGLSSDSVEKESRRAPCNIIFRSCTVKSNVVQIYNLSAGSWQVLQREQYVRTVNAP